MSQAQGEVVVEGVVVEQPAEQAAVRATTAGEIFGISEQTVSVPPGDVGLTFDWPLVVKEVAAGSPLFGRVQAGAALVAVDGVRATPHNIRDEKGGWTRRKGGWTLLDEKGLLDATKAKTLIFHTGRDLGIAYVGREGIVGPLMSTDAVVDVFAVDRGLFDAANAAKARTHWLHGRPGSLGREGAGEGAILTEGCCVPPLTFFSVLLCPIAACGYFENRRNPHEDMAFPDWADRALVFTDKGVVGQRVFSAKERKTEPDASYTAPVPLTVRVNGGINAITWDGFRIEDVRIRTFDGPSCMFSTPMMQGYLESCDPRFDSDPLELSCYFGLGCICCRYACHQPEAPGLYRVTIASIHKTSVLNGDDSYSFPTASIEVLALARSPDDLRNSLRAAKEKYGAPKTAKMAR